MRDVGIITTWEFGKYLAGELGLELETGDDEDGSWFVLSRGDTELGASKSVSEVLKMVFALNKFIEIQKEEAAA